MTSDRTYPANPDDYRDWCDTPVGSMTVDGVVDERPCGQCLACKAATTMELQSAEIEQLRAAIAVVRSLDIRAEPHMDGSATVALRIQPKRLAAAEWQRLREALDDQ